MVTAAQVQQAMDAVPRPMLWSPWWAISTLRPSAPPKPLTVPQRLSVPVSRDIVPDPPPDMPQAIPEAPVASALPTEVSEVKPVWQALLDVKVWRTRRFWRLAASLVVKRLNR